MLLQDRIADMDILAPLQPLSIAKIINLALESRLLAIDLLHHSNNLLLLMHRFFMQSKQ